MKIKIYIEAAPRDVPAAPSYEFDAAAIPDFSKMELVGNVKKAYEAEFGSPPYSFWLQFPVPIH